MKKLFLISTGLLLAGCQYTSPQKMEEPIRTPQKQAMMMEGDGMMQKDVMMKEDGMMEGDAMMQKDTIMMKEEIMKYIPYSLEKYQELKGKKRFVVFFYASWCPTCRSWEAKIKENADSLPAETIILKADYDTENELIRELGVQSQSTAVFFDSSGNVVEKTIDPPIKKVISYFQ